MNTVELLDIVSTGETSKVQFKEELPHKDSVAQEIVAMSNSLGGVILIGIKDVTGELAGLSVEQIEEYDRTISQIADNIKPIVYITTEVIKVLYAIIKNDSNIIVAKNEATTPIAIKVILNFNFWATRMLFVFLYTIYKIFILFNYL